MPPSERTCTGESVALVPPLLQFANPTDLQCIHSLVEEHVACGVCNVSGPPSGLQRLSTAVVCYVCAHACQLPSTHTAHGQLLLSSMPTCVRAAEACWAGCTAHPECVFSKWRAQVRMPRGCCFFVPWLSVGLLLAPSHMAQLEHLVVVTQLPL